MSFNIIFWCLMIFGFFFGTWNNWSDRTVLGNFGVTWFLLALLGWKVYPIAFN